MDRAFGMRGSACGSGRIGVTSSLLSTAMLLCLTDGAAAKGEGVEAGGLRRGSGVGVKRGSSASRSTRSASSSLRSLMVPISIDCSCWGVFKRKRGPDGGTGALRGTLANPHRDPSGGWTCFTTDFQVAAAPAGVRGGEDRGEFCGGGEGWLSLSWCLYGGGSWTWREPGSMLTTHASGSSMWRELEARWSGCETSHSIFIANLRDPVPPKLTKPHETHRILQILNTTTTITTSFFSPVLKSVDHWSTTYHRVLC